MLWPFQMPRSHAVLLALVLVAVYVTTEARYLPTRSQDDRLDRLRELLKDVSNVSYMLPVTDLNPVLVGRAEVPSQRSVVGRDVCFLLYLVGQ